MNSSFMPLFEEFDKPGSQDYQSEAAQQCDFVRFKNTAGIDVEKCGHEHDRSQPARFHQAIGKAAQFCGQICSSALMFRKNWFYYIPINRVDGAGEPATNPTSGV